MNADFCYATLKNSIQTFRLRKHDIKKATSRDHFNDEFVDEFGRKRKIIDFDDDEPKKVVNYMRPKAPGYYNFSTEERTKQQQILAITSAVSSEATFGDDLRRQRITAAKERNKKIRALKAQKYSTLVKHHSTSLLKKEN